MSRGYILVEGHGEVTAAPNLITRLWADLSLPHLSWARPIRPRGITSDGGVRRACEQLRAKDDVRAVLILRDDDDGCPQIDGPALADTVRELSLPFPVATVLAYREYESLFLASLPSLAGKNIKDASGMVRPGIAADAVFDGDPESIRDAKGWLSRHMPKGRKYKETLDQLPLTRMVDFGIVRNQGLPWFGTLERGLGHLASAAPGEVGVYPPAPAKTAKEDDDQDAGRPS